MPIQPPSHPSFELTDPDGLVFDDEPDLFVNLGTDPVIFTVRGIRYFEPRFRMIGQPIAGIQTREAFTCAYDRWMNVERELLGKMIAEQAAKEHVPDSYAILHAIWTGGLEEAERICARVERRKSSALRIVAGSTRER